MNILFLLTFHYLSVYHQKLLLINLLVKYVLQILELLRLHNFAK